MTPLAKVNIDEYYLTVNSDLDTGDLCTLLVAHGSRRRARSSLPQSAQHALRRVPSARASTRCRLPSTTTTSS
eukprot:1752392-Pleurochrysis_carterae.AAC.4